MCTVYNGFVISNECGEFTTIHAEKILLEMFLFMVRFAMVVDYISFLEKRRNMQTVKNLTQKCFTSHRKKCLLAERKIALCIYFVRTVYVVYEQIISDEVEQKIPLLKMEINMTHFLLHLYVFNAQIEILVRKTFISSVEMI